MICGESIHKHNIYFFGSIKSLALHIYGYLIERHYHAHFELIQVLKYTYTTQPRFRASYVIINRKYLTGASDF